MPFKYECETNQYHIEIRLLLGFGRDVQSCLISGVVCRSQKAATPIRVVAQAKYFSYN